MRGAKHNCSECEQEVNGAKEIINLEDLFEGRVWCGKSYDKVGGRGHGSTLRGPEEASGEMTANLRSYIYFKGGS